MNDAVLDASVAVQLIFPDPHTAHALSLVRDVAEDDRDLIAPYLLPIEVVNVIRRRMRREGLSLDEAQAALRLFLRYEVTFAAPEGLYERALDLTQRFSLGGHDAHYVALAEMMGIDLWTADERILRAIGGRLPFVRWIGDYAAAG